METKEERMRRVTIYYDESNSIHIDHVGLSNVELLGMADLLHAQSLKYLMDTKKQKTELKPVKKPKKVG